MPETLGGLEESDSGTMVDWEEEREKVLARGARWVSLSSGHVALANAGYVRVQRHGVLLVSFHDIL